jgi:hypothetical protein
MSTLCAYLGFFLLVGCALAFVLARVAFAAGL